MNRTPADLILIEQKERDFADEIKPLRKRHSFPATGLKVHWCIGTGYDVVDIKATNEETS